MRPGMIEVTGIPLEKLVRAAYAPSRQQGLGLFDPSGRHGGLTDDQVAEIVERGKNDSMLAVSMDYVNGRACKFRVKRGDEGRLFIERRWYDHSTDQLRDLLEAVGLARDLVDKARAEKDAHEAECLEAAVAFIRERGIYAERRGEMRDDPLPPKVREGLAYGMYSDPPRIAEDYDDGTSTYSLAPAT